MLMICCRGTQLQYILVLPIQMARQLHLLLKTGFSTIMKPSSLPIGCLLPQRKPRNTFQILSSDIFQISLEIHFSHKTRFRSFSKSNISDHSRNPIFQIILEIQYFRSFSKSNISDQFRNPIFQISLKAKQFRLFTLHLCT